MAKNIYLYLFGNAQAKNSIKKAQAKAQATRGEKLLARDKRRDFARNNFVLLQLIIVLK